MQGLLPVSGHNASSMQPWQTLQSFVPLNDTHWSGVIAGEDGYLYPYCRLSEVYASRLDLFVKQFNRRKLL